MIKITQSKKFVRNLILIIILFYLYLFKTNAYTSHNGNYTDTGKVTQSKIDSNVVFLPIVGYTPETSALAGASLMYFCPKHNEPKPDFYTIFGLYTFYNQILSGFASSHYFSQSTVLLKTYLVVTKYPYKFYGIGPGTPQSNEEKYTPFHYRLRECLLFNLFDKLYIGPLYTAGYFKLVETEQNGILAEGSIPGSTPTVVSGLGYELEWDKRDNSFYPKNGLYLKSRMYRAHTRIGSDFNFYTGDIDFRYYFRLYKEHILSLQCYLDFSQGDVPFQLMSKLGGANKMRGYYEGRYLDKNYIMAQAEYRFPLYWKFSGVLFFGLGEVAPSMKEYCVAYLRMAGGSGLRYALNKERGINFRLDFGLYDLMLKKDTYGVYFSVMEAF